MRRALLFLLLPFLLLQVASGQDEPGKNLLRNPSFEDANSPWKETGWNGNADFAVAEIGKTGNKSVSIASKSGADASWSLTVKVNPYAEYKLSGWVKTEDVKKANNGAGVLFNVHGLEKARTKALTGTNDWTKLECVFQTDGQDELQVNCLFGGWGTATGKAYFDDVSLELVKTLPVKAAVPDDWAPTVKIDLAKKGESLNPMIYGQFIEHLGRCIYGGIWAEILQDRKFWYPVGQSESPWFRFGDCEISMNKEDAFVGAHTPELLLEKSGGSASIAQRRIGLAKDMKYKGYVWLKCKGEVKSINIFIDYMYRDGNSTMLPIPVAVKAGDYYKHEFEFTTGTEEHNDCQITITANGKGSVLIGTVSLMPENNINGMRPDTLALLQELDSPIYRWPGGNFVSGYDWKDGIGDRDRRPPRKNPAWTGVEHNDFGLDEFMVFCKYLKTEPYIAVNTGDGQVDNALKELEYANGKADTPMGKWRAENGHPEPYNVKWWGIGNEMFGNWQIGHMPVLNYVKKNNEFVEAFRKFDPKLRLIAVGEVGRWDEAFIPGAAEHMDYISEHFYNQEKPKVVDHVRLIPDSIKRISDAHRKYRAEMPELKGKDIKIAMDEWNYWYGPHVFGELGTRYFMKDGLGIAAGLHEFARNSDLYIMANYAQTVNVIGCIKTNATNAQFETTGLVLKLYRKEFGSVPLTTEVVTEVQSPLDVQAALSEDGKYLTIGVVNPLDRELELEFSGVGDLKTGKKFEIFDPENNPKGYNDPGKPQRIEIKESTVDSKKIKFKPYSVSLLKYAL